MIIILAAIGFMIVFLMGFRVQPPVVGSVIPDSPAAHAARADGTPKPLAVGDRILMYDGKWQHDFTKITLNVALSGQGNVPVYVRHLDNTEERLNVVPARSDLDPSGFLMIGVGPPLELRGLDTDQKLEEEVVANPKLFVSEDYLAVQPGETITAINGQPVKVDEYGKLERAMNQSDGEPVKIAVADTNGQSNDRELHPQFMQPFGSTPINFAGMVPRATIEQVNTNSSAKGKLLPGDVVLAIIYKNGDTQPNLTVMQVKALLEKAGKTEQPVTFRVLRNGEEKEIKDLVPNVRISKGIYGLSVALSIDDEHAVVAETMDKSPAAMAGIPSGATITAIDGQAVQSWFDVKRLMTSAKAGEAIKIAATTPTGAKEFTLKLNADQIADVAGLYYATVLAYPVPMLHDRVEPRKTDKPLIAAAWGVTETRDFVLQFYLTIHRMIQGSISYKNMMGPVGIFNAGRQFAYKGVDWLIWFLAMISANLAVVNFLPIPIVDGGLFTFLIVEKIQGKPLSAKTQSIAQVVGLAIILSVFLLVTYQDIARLAL